MDNKFKNLKICMWRLPDKGKRKLLPFLFVPKHIRQGVKADRDGDYLCYQAGAIIEKVGLIVLILALVDVFGQFGWFVDLELVAENKVAFVGEWGKIVGKVALVISFFYYLRLRLPMNLKEDQIPFFPAKKSFRGKSRREWIGNTAVFSLLCLLLTPFILNSYEGHSDVIGRLNLNNNLYAVILWQFIAIFALPILISFGLSCALIWEKSVRFFSEVQKDLENW